jgi:hypothetical protein
MVDRGWIKCRCQKGDVHTERYGRLWLACNQVAGLASLHYDYKDRIRHQMLIVPLAKYTYRPSKAWGEVTSWTKCLTRQIS